MAALLLFGKEEIIQSTLPHYKIDALVRRVDMDRYDDRLNIRCNLVDAYQLLMDFVAKHLPDKFYLQDDQRISLWEKIFREEDLFTVEIPLFIDKKSTGELNGELNGELTEGQQKVFVIIKNSQGIKAGEISKKLDMPFSTVDKHIRVLLTKKFIERRGSKKTDGYWLI